MPTMMPMPWQLCSLLMRSGMAACSVVAKGERPSASFSAVRVSASRLLSTISSAPLLRSLATQRLAPGTSCRPALTPMATRQYGEQRRITTSMSATMGYGNFNTCVLCPISGPRLRRVGPVLPSCSGLRSEDLFENVHDHARGWIIIHIHVAGLEHVLQHTFHLGKGRPGL